MTTKEMGLAPATERAGALPRQPRNRRHADVIAPRQFREGRTLGYHMIGSKSYADSKSKYNPCITKQSVCAAGRQIIGIFPPMPSSVLFPCSEAASEPANAVTVRFRTYRVAAHFFPQSLSGIIRSPWRIS
jgi:hypothetical protein